jgi:predicted O-methyltransferase YrrM
MTAIRDEIMGKLLRYDPWALTEILPTDHQGWNSTHRWLAQAIAEVHPQVVVEIGVWKGASVINMASWMRDLGLNGVVIAVDTWLGSAEHWGSDDVARIYPQFLANVANADLRDYVLPLRLDSLNAARLLRRLEIVPDVIHLDAGHDYNSVFADLTEWWPMLRPGGVFLGDDYYTDGQWPAVKVAVDQFFQINEISFEHMKGKCRVRKSVLTTRIDATTSAA